LDGLRTPNWNGDLPLLDEDPTRPNEAYFAHVDAVVHLAASRGLHIGMLPTCGDKWNRKWGVGPEIFTPENARTFGAYVGRRYADQPIIWILGGDRPIESEEHRLIVRAMAEGLREGDGSRLVLTFHTWGPHASAEYVPDEPWLDFHTCQSGHKRNRENWRFIDADYRRAPTRPCMDLEPGYEDAQDDITNLDGGYLDNYDARKALYWALFAGAHGHTYGCWPVWQMWRPGLGPSFFARRPWYEALHLPGASQMRHARDLLLSRPFLSRIPDQSLIAAEAGAGTYHLQATRDAAGRYALIYIPALRTRPFQAGSIELDLSRLSGERLAGSWFDPRTGVAQSFGVFARQDRLRITPPDGGPDWVLVLDDAASGFPPPGSPFRQEPDRPGAA
ncbi:MAG TPA: glycoside hydrolase family 140 protein, partial [Thermomicrobiales bacterium]|nr:glycoside hydrolase family 140 protein [Thermomicrobiales bacterium]